MRDLHPDFRDLFALLNSEGVRYLVIGGYAVNFHGYHRNTKDVDIWIALEQANADRVSRALQRFGFSSASVPASGFLERGRVFIFGREPIRVDILNDPSGVEFEACYSRRVEIELEGVRMPFISLSDLRQNKTACNRIQDQADLHNLPPASE